MQGGPGRRRTHDVSKEEDEKTEKEDEVKEMNKEQRKKAKTKQERALDELEVCSPGPKVKDAHSEKVLAATRSGQKFRAPFDDIHCEEIGEDDIFRLLPDGPPVEKALDLAKQLQAQLEGDAFVGVDDIDEDSDEDSESGARKKIINATLDFQTQIRDCIDGPPSSIVMLGWNGEGKSSLANWSVQVTEVSEPQYALNTRTEAASPDDDAELRMWLYDKGLEGVRHLQQLKERGYLQREVTKEDIFFQAGDQVDYVSATREKLALRGIRRAYYQGPPGEEIKAPYLLPAASGSSSTTKIALKIRQGTTYHMVIRYKAEEAIRQEISSYAWHQLEELVDQDEKDPDRLICCHLLEMLLLISGSEHDKCSLNDLETLELNEFLGKLPITKDGEVTICDKVKEKLDKRFEIVSGRGKRLLDDRLFVRDALLRVMDDKAISSIVEECIVYAPADALEGLELVDAPGAGSKNPMEQKQMMEALRVADGVLVVMQRSLSDTDIDGLIHESRVLERILSSYGHNGGGSGGGGGQMKECPLYIFSAMDEKGGFTTAQGLNDRMDIFSQNKSKILQENDKCLKTLLFQTSKRMDAHMSKEVRNNLVNMAMDRMKSNMFSTKPLLWTSLTLSPARDPEEEPHSPTPQGAPLTTSEGDVRKKCLGALQDFGRLLHAMRLQSSRDSRVAVIMAGFIKAVRPEPDQLEPDQLESDQEVRTMIVDVETILTDKMRDAAKFEAQSTFRGSNRDHELQAFVTGFDLEVYQELKKRGNTFADGKLKEFTKEMVKVEVEDIEKEIKKKMQDQSLSRSLRNVFSNNLAGTFKKFALFNIFFSKFCIPPISELESAIESFRHLAVDLLRKVMQKNIKETLIKTGESHTHTRQGGRQADNIRPALEEKIRQAVQACITLESKSPASRVLEQALGVLKTIFAKRKATSMKKLLDDSQKESLKQNLLDKTHKIPWTKLDEWRSKVVQLVEENAQKVIDDAKKRFENEIVKSLETTLRDVNSRFFKRDKRGLPIFIKLRRMCYGKLLELTVEAEPCDFEEEKKLKELLNEFSEKWDSLSSNSELPKEEEDGEGVGGGEPHDWIGRIFSRHLLAFLQEHYQTKPETGKRMKSVGLKPISKTDVQALLKRMSKRELDDTTQAEGEFEKELSRIKLRLGSAEGDGSCLFRSLQQLWTGHEGNEDGHQALRREIVHVVLSQNQTEDARRSFVNYHGVSVDAWANRMMKLNEWGDEVVLEYFARHHQVNIHVHTPVGGDPTRPMEFPTFLDRGEDEHGLSRISSGFRRASAGSVYRLAHVLGAGQSSAEANVPIHYVPVWRRRIAWTPDSRLAETWRYQEPEDETSAKTASMEAVSAGLVAKNRKLPPGWKCQKSDSEGGKCYFNNATLNVSVWPEQFDDFIAGKFKPGPPKPRKSD